MNTTIQPSATSTMGLRRRGGEVASLEITDRATSTAIEVIIPGMSDIDRAELARQLGVARIRHHNLQEAS